MDDVRDGDTSPAPLPTTGAGERQSWATLMRKSHSVGERKLDTENMGGF